MFLIIVGSADHPFTGIRFFIHEQFSLEQLQHKLGLCFLFLLVYLLYLRSQEGHIFPSVMLSPHFLHFIFFPFQLLQFIVIMCNLHTF